MSAIGLLRAIDDQEIELMRSWRNAPGVRANMYTRHEIGEREHAEWWARVRRSADRRYFMYDEAGQPRGVVGFTGIDPSSQNSSWAFYASPEAPKGTGSRMEFAALDYAFDTLKLHKLYCEVLAFNSPVIRLHQKFGFQVEGIFREQHKVDAQYVDVYRLGLLAKEWQATRTSIHEKIR